MREPISGYGVMLLVFCTSAIAAGDEPVPKTPWECRQFVLKEIERFGKQRGPDTSRSGGDEHIARGMMRGFSELKSETTLILADAGDKAALKKLVRELAIDQEDEDRWLEEKQSLLYGYDPYRSERTFSIVRVLEARQPELARKARARMMRLWGRQARRSARAADCEQMTLKELTKAAHEGDLEATLRWARLDPDGATPWLTQRIEDAKVEVGDQCVAARVLARIGDARGLAWLRKAAVGNVGLGGSPGAGLLAAGDEGRKIYFTLVREHINKKSPLPAAFVNAPQCLDTDLFCKLLPEFFALTNDSLNYEVSQALKNHTLPAVSITFLAEQARRGKYRDQTLLWGIRDSVYYHACKDYQARQAAHLWVDEMLAQDDVDAWNVAAQVFLWTGLGSNETAASGARRQLSKNTLFAARILAETGAAEDVLAIWNVTHPQTPAKDASGSNWYDLPSAGWFATVRLTNHLAPR